MRRHRSWAFASVCSAFVAVLLTATSAHADEWRDKQWHLSFLKAEEVQQITKGKGVTVAVVDSGVDGDHPDLTGNVLKGTDVTDSGDGWRDQDGHGTAMASLIAGHGHGTGNHDGILGLAPESMILPVNVHVGATGGKDSRPDVIRGLEYAVSSDAKVISFSTTMSGIPDEVESALARDIVFVAAAGNSAQDGDVQQPASYPGVVAVSGLDQSGNFTNESVQGPEVVLSAPAMDIAGAGAGKRGKYFIGTGTSGATALVSATAALIRAKYPDLSANGVINRLIKTADDKGPPGRDPKYGFGVVNPLKALTADIPDIDYNPLIGSSAAPSATALATSPPVGAPDDDAGGNLPLVLVIAAGTIVLVALGVLLVVRRNRRRWPGSVSSPHAWPPGPPT